MDAFVMPHIIAPQPTKVLNTDNWAIPKGIPLADSNFNRPSEVDVLIGAEFFYDTIRPERLQLQEGLPSLQNTVFGWVVSGPVKTNASHQVSCGIFSEDEINLQERVEQFWKLEEVEGPTTLNSVADQQCETYFSTSTIRNQDGQFVVRLPFKDSPSLLGDSKGTAIRRFHSLEARLNKQPELKNQYIQFMKEYETLGHMKEISQHKISRSNYMIPHHCVLKPDSSTTKLRVVFDASAKTSSGLSLNDILHTGPTIQRGLFSILMRFRVPRFVFTADIEKMYRQILVHPDDRHLQLIVWRSSSTEPLKFYELQTVSYGTRPAPYLATRCLQQLGQQLKNKYPMGAEVVLNNFYVDDCLAGADTIAAATDIQNQVKGLLKEGGFELRKWCANHPALLQSVPLEDQEINLNLGDDASQGVKTLGLIWSPKNDMLCIKAHIKPTERLTKRSMISDVAQIFDPLGLLAPVVVAAKVLIQRAWELQLSWDEELPEGLHNSWSRFKEQIPSLNNLAISRQVVCSGLNDNVQIHTFVDASEKAYGAAVYIRCNLQNGTITSRLLCAKSRIAPLKKVTIPRLELCAAVLGAELTARVKVELNHPQTPATIWSDSQIVLAWVNSTSAIHQTFVANRIAKIHELSKPEEWRYVRSSDNPADIVSRGASPADIRNLHQWFYGPLFLYRRSAKWPEPPRNATFNESDFERKQRVVVQLVHAGKFDHPIYAIEHKNSFMILQRVLAYILRFCNRARKRLSTQHQHLSTMELNEALTVIVKTVQRTEFENEIKQLTERKEISSSSVLSACNPFLDQQGQLRIGGRLESSSSLSYEAKHPVILPYNDSITKLIFQWYHDQHMHCGPQALLALVRQRFWPIKGKTMARATVHQCVRCTRAKPKLLHQLMGDLPQNRVEPARPFIKCGVDFCGPFWAHFKIRGKAPRKVYVAIFCCFSTKAVHMEVVSDLTTDAFIGCLKRFISRRGHCSDLYCDNATNFVGAKNQLTALKDILYSDKSSEAIQKVCAAKGIQFHFMPPRAPHFGGLWEAAVKSAKHLFVRTAGNASLTYEELETVMVEIEAILNSRPLTPLSTHPEDLAALTPGHFLIGEPLTAMVDPHAQPASSSLLTRWRLVAHLKTEFWKRWTSEYLNELQSRSKWKGGSANIEPGTLVVIKEDNVQPLQWPLGRVLKCYEGNDGKVRVVDLKTAAGTCKRAIHRLAPLPIVNESDEDGVHIPTKRRRLAHEVPDNAETE